MNDTIIAAKAKEQHDKFMGKVFTHFSKPKARFVRESTYGIQASGDTKLSSVVRAIDDDVEPIQTEKRLSRNIEDEHLGDAVAQAILAEGANLVKKDTLILVYPTEIRKEYAYKMECLTRVRDASSPCRASGTTQQKAERSAAVPRLRDRGGDKAGVFGIWTTAEENRNSYS